MSEVMKFYRYHPVTGADANEIDTIGWTDQNKDALARMIREGAKFYWEKEDTPGEGIQGYTRVERANVLFVLTVMGTNYEFVERPIHGA